MPRKGKKTKSNVKNDETVSLDQSSSCLKCARSVFLNENFDRWCRIRSECSFSNDEDFTKYLLDLVESRIKSDHIGNDASEDNVPKCMETALVTNTPTHESKSIFPQGSTNNNVKKLKNRSSSREQSSESRPKTEESPVDKDDVGGEIFDRIGDEEKENLRLDEVTETGTSTVVEDDISITSRLGASSHDSQCKPIVSSNCNSSTETSIILKETEQNQDFTKVKKHQQNKNPDKATNVSPGKSKNCKKKKFSTLERGRREDPDERRNISEPVTLVDKSKNDSCAPHQDVSVLAVGGDLPLEEKISVIDDDNSTSKNHSVAITIKVCGECDSRHVQNSCPLRSPQNVVDDSLSWEEYSRDGVDAEDSLAGEQQSSFAFASLPGCLELRVTDSEHGLGVVTRQPVPAFTRFGPLIGRSIKQMDIPDDSSMKHIWQTLDECGACAYTSTEQANTSNWVRWLRPAPSRDQRNLAAVLLQPDRRLYFVTTAPLADGEELLYWTDHAWSTKKQLTKTNCGGCNLQFAHAIYYHRHCAVFHDPNFSLTIRKYHCKICGLSVLGKENIMKHAATNHDGKGAYQCQFCKKFFLRLNYLEMHRTYGCSLNPHRTRPLCDYCGRKFCQPQKLKIHIKRMHSEISEVLKEFQCKRCLKILGSRAALQRHIKEVHHKAVLCSCTCDKCGKMFQNKSNLKIHMLTHSGIKPFKCQQNGCSAAFTTKQCLQLHYKKVHGYADSKMPTIERSVAYTFDAYAGERQVNDASASADANASVDSCCSSPDHGQLAIDDGEMDDQQQIEIEQVDDYRQYSSPHLVEEQEELAGYDECEERDAEWVEEAVASPDNNSQPREPEHGFYRFGGGEKSEQVMVAGPKPESSNASLLVEAALDAAEKDIELSFRSNKMSPDPLFPILHGNIERMSPPLHRELSKSISVDYSMSHHADVSRNLADQAQYNTGCSSPAPTLRPHPGYTLMPPHFELHLSPTLAPIDSYPHGSHEEALRYDSQQQRRPDDYSSSDDNDNAVQNLSIGLKNKSLQLDLHTGYKYDAVEERNESGAFDCVGVEGVDMSRSGIYHHAAGFVSRYPHALYEQRSYAAAHSAADVLRVVNLSHSIDLSLSRAAASHHHISMGGVSPPPPPYQNYPSPPPPPPPPAAPPYLATATARTSHSPNISMYHHFSSY